MIDAITQVGDDLYNFVSNLNITSVEPDGWAHTFNRPFEPDEVTAGEYPVLMVVPAEDEGTTLDSFTDSDRLVFWVHLIYSVQELKMAGNETQVRRLADLVRNCLKAERAKPNPLGNDAYDLQVSGTWGWDAERGERYYRLIVTVQIAQELT